MPIIQILGIATSIVLFSVSLYLGISTCHEIAHNGEDVTGYKILGMIFGLPGTAVYMFLVLLSLCFIIFVYAIEFMSNVITKLKPAGEFHRIMQKPIRFSSKEAQ